MAKSKNYFKGLGLAGLVSLTSCVAPEKGLDKIIQDGQQASAPVPANGSKPSGLDYNVKIADKYLARIGLIFFDEPVLQTGLTYSNANLPGLRVGYWENRLLGNGELTEIDTSVSYGRSFEGLDTSVKTNYIFLDSFTSFRDVVELTANVSTNDLPLTFGAEANAVFSPDNNRDIGFEYLLSARKDLTLTPGLTANAWTDIHYNSHYFTPDSTLSVSNIGAGLNWDVFRNGIFNLGISGQQQYTLGDNFDDQSLVSANIGGSLKF